MWGWEDSACAICGAPYCLCDCNEQIKAINSDLKVIKSDLERQLGITCEKVPRKGYVSPEFLVALHCQGARRALLRALADEIPEVILTEAFVHGEITEAESLEIHRLREEANAPWHVRAWRKICEE